MNAGANYEYQYGDDSIRHVLINLTPGLDLRVPINTPFLKNILSTDKADLMFLSHVVNGLADG